MDLDSLSDRLKQLRLLLYEKNVNLMSYYDFQGTLIDHILRSVEDLNPRLVIQMNDKRFSASQANTFCEEWEMLRHDVYTACMIQSVGQTQFVVDQPFSVMVDEMLPFEEKYYGNLDFMQSMTNNFAIGVKIGLREWTKRDLLDIISDTMRRTPDNYKIEKQELTLIDFAVSINPNRAIEEKFRKYTEDCETLIKFFSAIGYTINSSVLVYCGDIANNRDLIASSEVDTKIEHRVQGEFWDAFSWNNRIYLSQFMNDEEKELFQEVDPEEVQVFYNLSINEKAARAIMTTDFHTWLDNLVEASGQRDLFRKLTKNYNADTDPNLRAAVRDSCAGQIYSLERDAIEAAEEMESPFERPTPRSVKKAFANFHKRILEGNSKFTRVDRAKPNFHFVWPVTADKITSDNGDTKQEVIRNVTMNCPGSYLDVDKCTDLMHIMIFLSNLSRSDFALFQKKGLVCDNFFEESSVENTIRGRNMYIPRQAGKKRQGTISLKRVGPHLRHKLDEAKVGMSKEEKIKEKEENTRNVRSNTPNVESLPFWNQKERKLHVQNWKDESDSLKIKIEEVKDDDAEMSYLRGTSSYNCLYDISILFKNILFLSQSHRRNRFAIATCPNPYMFAVILPGEDLQSSNGCSFYYVFKQRRGTPLISGLEVELMWETEEGFIYASQTVRLDKVRLRTLSVCWAKFCILYKCLCSLTAKRNFKMALADVVSKDYMELCMIMSFYSVTNLSINMSSLMDNVRYLVLGAAGEYSGVSEFIDEKMDVAIKTSFQMFLYDRTLNLLANVGGVELSEISDIEGAYVGHFSGLTGDDMISDLVDVIQESYSIFFAVEKGLHNYFHAMVDIHKVAFDYQCKFLMCKNPVNKSMTYGENFTYNPELIMISSMMCNNFTQKEINRIRRGFKVLERPYKHPLTIKTMSSLKKCVSPRPKQNTISMAELDKKIRQNTRDELDELNDAIHFSLKSIYVYEKIDGKNVLTMKKQTKLRGVALGKALKLEGFTHFIEASSQTVVDAVTNLIQSPYPKVPDADISEIPLHVEEQVDMNLTEMLSKSICWLVIDPDRRLARVVRKFQRTQKDREIYLVSIEYKVSLYFVEHFYKQVNRAIPEEWISISGDAKYLELFKEKAPEDWYNLTGDCSKWSAGDNQDKFIFNIAGNCALTESEKYLFMFLMYLYRKKKLLLDNEMCNYLKRMSESQRGAIHENPFFLLTDGVMKNYADITHNWLQGQLNYLSSNVHACCARFIKNCAEKHLQMKVNYAVHSDDFKIEYHLRKLENHEPFLCLVDLIMNLHCLKINKKKSFIHQKYLEMVSMIIYLGEARPSWVKLAMSVISGLPYLGFEQDRDSALSKIQAAILMGCPKSVACIAQSMAMKEVFRTYSMHETGVNFPGKIFSKHIKEIPSFLGGWGSDDCYDIATLGTKGQDVKLLYNEMNRLHKIHTLKRPRLYRLEDFIYNFEDLDAESKLELQDEIENSWIIQAFIKRLKLVENNLQDEWETSDVLGSLFRFKRFINVALKYDTLLYKKFPDGEDWQEKKDLWMQKHPSYSLMKPQTNDDLNIYFRLLLDNPSFLRSYTNQSQEQLLINRVRSSRDRIMSLPIDRDSLDPLFTGNKGVAEGDNVTIVEGLSWFKYESEVKINMEDLTLALNVWIRSDPKVRTWLNVVQNTTMGKGMSLKLFYPRRMPEPESNRVFSAPITNILQWIYDKETFEKDGKELTMNKSLTRDVEFIRDFVRKTFGDSFEKDKWKNLRLVFKLLTGGEMGRIYMAPTSEIGSLSQMWCQMYRSCKQDFTIVEGDVLENIDGPVIEHIEYFDQATAVTNLCYKISSHHPPVDNPVAYKKYFINILKNVWVGNGDAYEFLNDVNKNSSKNLKIWKFFVHGKDEGLNEEIWRNTQIIVRRAQTFSDKQKRYVGVFKLLGVIQHKTVTVVEFYGDQNGLLEINYSGDSYLATNIMNSLHNYLEKKWGLKVSYNNLFIEASRGGFVLQDGRVKLFRKKLETHIGIKIERNSELSKITLRDSKVIVASDDGLYVDLMYGDDLVRLETHFVERTKSMRRCLSCRPDLKFLVSTLFGGSREVREASLLRSINEGLLDVRSIKSVSLNVNWLRVLADKHISSEFLVLRPSQFVMGKVEKLSLINLDELLASRGLKKVTLPREVLEMSISEKREIQDLIGVGMAITNNSAKMDWYKEYDTDDEDHEYPLPEVEIMSRVSKAYRFGKITESDKLLMHCIIHDKLPDDFKK